MFWNRRGDTECIGIEVNKPLRARGAFEGFLPVGVEVCVRKMRHGETAIVQCNGQYGTIAAPIFNEQPDGEKEKVQGRKFREGRG